MHFPFLLCDRCVVVNLDKEKYEKEIWMRWKIEDVQSIFAGCQLPIAAASATKSCTKNSKARFTF